jgi:hypothetical protein
MNTVAKSKLQRDYILPIENIKAVVIDGKVFFYGGVSNNNLSKSIFYYNVDTRDIIRLPEVPTPGRVLCLLKDKDKLSFLDEANNLYSLINGRWKYIDTYHLGDNLLTIFTNNNQYIISDGKLYQYNGGVFSVVFESNLITASGYIPSPDKEIIYFKKCTIDLKNNHIIENTNTADYVIYGQEKFLDYNKPIVIDKVNSYIFSYDSPITQIEKKTLSSDNWFVDIFKNQEKAINPIEEVLIDGSDFYFSAADGSVHNIYKSNLTSKEIVKVQTIQRKNSSYSKNVQYNHNSPVIVKYKNSVAFMGNGGYYNDNGIYDNSLFFNGNLEHKLSLDIRKPVYFSTGNMIFILDTERSLIHEYSFTGRLVEEYSVPVINNITRMRIHGNNIIVGSEDMTCVISKKDKKILIAIRHEDSLYSALDKNHVYYLSNNTERLVLNKIAYSTGNIKHYTLDTNDYSKVKLFANDGYTLLYVEKEDYTWEINRIITDE